MNNVANKHVPKKLASRKKQKLLDKPWITSGILKSIKKKQKMYHTHFLSNNPRKVIEFKKYANLLAHLKEKTKKEFYRSQFEKCKNNLKTTWKLVGTLVNRKTKGQTIPNKILADNRIYTKQSDIAERFNNYFVNIGPELASKIADNNICPTQFINKSPTSSFICALLLNHKYLLFCLD